MDADYTAWASAVAAFSAVVCWTNHLFIVIMANAYRNADLSLAIYRPLRTGRRFTAKICNLYLVLHKCSTSIYFLLLLTQVDFFGNTFYFLESSKFSHYFYLLKSRIFGMYVFYFLESSKVVYFWQHCCRMGVAIRSTLGLLTATVDDTLWRTDVIRLTLSDQPANVTKNTFCLQVILVL